MRDETEVLDAIRKLTSLVPVYLLQGRRDLAVIADLIANSVLPWAMGQENDFAQMLHGEATEQIQAVKAVIQ